jgi:hypothetical protein
MVATSNSSFPFNRRQNSSTSSQPSSSDSTSSEEKVADSVQRSKRRNMGLHVETTDSEDINNAQPKSTIADGGAAVALASSSPPSPPGDGGGQLPAGGSAQHDYKLSPSDKTRHLVEAFRRRGSGSFGESSTSGRNTPIALRSPRSMSPGALISDGFLENMQTERQRTEERIQVIKKLRQLNERHSKGQSVDGAADSHEFIIMAQPVVAIRRNSATTAQPLARPRSNSFDERVTVSNPPGHRAATKPNELGAIKHFQKSSPPQGVVPTVRGVINHGLNGKSLDRHGGTTVCPQDEDTIKEPLTYGHMLRARSRDVASTIVVKRPIAMYRPPASPKRIVDVHNKEERMTPSATTSQQTFGVGSSLDLSDDAVHKSRGGSSPAFVVVHQGSAPRPDDRPSSSAKRNNETLMENETVRMDRSDKVAQSRDEAPPARVHEPFLPLDDRESPSAKRNETPVDSPNEQVDQRDSPSPVSHHSDQNEVLAERGRADCFLVELAKAKSVILALQQRLAAAENASQASKEELLKARQGKAPFWKRNVRMKDQQLYDDMGSQTAKDNEDLVKQLLNVIQTLPVCDEISLRINLANGEGGWDIVSARAENCANNDTADHSDPNAQN